ncbi:transmembrane emp24 domain-containing protein 1-like [Gigantopelta aegis]|uniref:transmembrane emp24 domain-containing protein 1-like n=1 Tax=Gigantopelta aegis TaxID=1735272 RepID=UPI001B88C94C|nr:transmembrane emp24 domain-containing protein 1-like [Gigantopelta aegis]
MIDNCVNIETDLTVEVNAGSEHCFFQSIKKSTSIEIEYQVIDGGDLDINFYVHSPNHVVLAADSRKTENVVKVEANMIGDYKFCLDNRFSRFSKKLVFFELTTTSGDDDDDDDDDDWEPNKDELVELVDMKIEDFKNIIASVKVNLEKSVQLQNLVKMFEARDRNIQENNFERVNLWSCVFLVVMMLVGLTQVIMIRHLFANKASQSVQTMKVRT